MIFSRSSSTKGFTLIEIMIVILIIGVLTTAGINSYMTSVRSSRDGRRRLDMDAIRNALEMYRSNQQNSTYPTNAQGIICLQGAGAAPCNNRYITLPTDPLNRLNYLYQALPAGCDNAATFCSDYTIGAILEVNPPAACLTPLNGCNRLTGGGTTSCNTCVGPYGRK